jgi:aspartokinase
VPAVVRSKIVAPETVTSMIVMKFGGTSVEHAKAIQRVASIVKHRIEQRPVVVVSAMARVTDTLLSMARTAGAGERKNALKLCRSLQERHYETASELLGTALFTDFHSELGAESARSLRAPPITSLPSARFFPAKL